MQSQAHASAGLPPSQRHYGLDWLRIAAFALLIVYHIAMVFAPWEWVIHVPHSYPALIAPMAALTPWRLPLLFAVSGYASRQLLRKTGGPSGFARQRAWRLLVPLAFGMAVLVPIEMWVLVRVNGYPGSYLTFWLHDYWRWGDFYGREFPSWEHLWFVAYLAAYTFVLAAMLRWTRAMAWIDRAAAWMAVGNRILWVPVVTLVLLKLALLFVVAEKQGLARDWAGHSLYFPVFVAGFAIGGDERLWPAIARVFRPALLLALLAGVTYVAIEVAHPGTSAISHATMAADRAAKVTMGWAMIVALFHIAQSWWNYNHRWRATLAEAVFPFYIVHHPVIVLLAWITLPLALNPFAEFALLLGGTSAACIATYAIGRRIGWLRPLIGLSSKPRAIAPAAPERLAVR